MIPYEGARVYGPYTRKADNRKHVVIVFSDGKKKTVSYPRYVIEMNIGRYLTTEEEIHHLDGDETNDNIFNLSVMPKSAHKKMLRGSKYGEEKVICVECKKEFILTAEQVKDRFHNQAKGKTGPFCSRECAGKFGKMMQLLNKRA